MASVLCLLLLYSTNCQSRCRQRKVILSGLRMKATQEPSVSRTVRIAGLCLLDRMQRRCRRLAMSSHSHSCRPSSPLPYNFPLVSSTTYFKANQTHHRHHHHNSFNKKLTYATKYSGDRKLSSFFAINRCMYAANYSEIIAIWRSALRYFVGILLGPFFRAKRCTDKGEIR